MSQRHGHFVPAIFSVNVSFVSFCVISHCQKRGRFSFGLCVASSHLLSDGVVGVFLILGEGEGGEGSLHGLDLFGQRVLLLDWYYSCNDWGEHGIVVIVLVAIKIQQSILK